MVYVQSRICSWEQNHTILWHFQLQINQTYQERRPDSVLINKVKRCQIVNVVVPAEYRLKWNGKEKPEKSSKLRIKWGKGENVEKERIWLWFKVYKLVCEAWWRQCFILGLDGCFWNRLILFINDITRDASSRINSEVYGHILSVN